MLIEYPLVRLHISHICSHTPLWRGPLDPTKTLLNPPRLLWIFVQSLWNKRVSWKEPGNGRGTFLCCLELHTAVSNNSPVYFPDAIDSTVQNCHKKSWAITSLHCISSGIFFPENFSVPLYMTTRCSLLNFLFCCYSKYELEDIYQSMKLFYFHSGL